MINPVRNVFSRFCCLLLAVFQKLVQHITKYESIYALIFAPSFPHKTNKLFCFIKCSDFLTIIWAEIVMAFAISFFLEIIYKFRNLGLFRKF